VYLCVYVTVRGGAASCQAVAAAPFFYFAPETAKNQQKQKEKSN
tara:strand:+ start:364 stop:495 length:132 start_codon:yes stop_codon:yes gene_type:complete